jgi:fibronectin type 3 domain-containing protein
MTYRIYARWADGKVSDKTTTESRTVADFAWSELCKIRWEDTNKPEGLTYTFRANESKKPVQISYVDFTT